LPAASPDQPSSVLLPSAEALPAASPDQPSSVLLPSAEALPAASPDQPSSVLLPSAEALPAASPVSQVVDLTEDKYKQKLWFTKTKYGGPMMVFLGYPFIQDNKRATENSGDDHVNWKCNFQGCFVRAHTPTVQEGPVVLTLHGQSREDVPHSHIANIDKLIARDKQCEMKRRALATTEAPRTIIREIQKTMPIESTTFLSSAANIAHQIQTMRRKQHGKVASTLAEANVPFDMTVTTDGSSFLLDDTGADDPERILVFGTEANLQYMRKRPEWFIDGTFDVAPLIFKQLFTFQVVENNFNLPLIYALLPDKKHTTYLKLMDIVAKHIVIGNWAQLPNLKWRCDFEKSIWKGIFDFAFGFFGYFNIILRFLMLFHTFFFKFSFQI
jgi:hypothetical protein